MADFSSDDLPEDFDQSGRMQDDEKEEEAEDLSPQKVN